MTLQWGAQNKKKVVIWNTLIPILGKTSSNDLYPLFTRFFYKQCFFLVEAQLLLKILKNQPRLLLACCLIISTCKCVHMIGYTVRDVYVLES